MLLRGPSQEKRMFHTKLETKLTIVEMTVNSGKFCLSSNERLKDRLKGNLNE